MLQEGLYLAENKEHPFNFYRIILQVKETPKSYILIKKEYENRYSYDHIATMFSKGDRLVLRKERNPHPMRIWDDSSFTIYPYQAGIPFYFKRLPAEADPKRPQLKIYRFQEHDLSVSGEEQDLLQLAEYLKDAEGTLGDLRYQIEYAFDIDGTRSGNSESDDAQDPDYAQRYLYP